MPGLPIAWTLFIAWSLISLFLYRSPAEHGPDMVGEEVFRFLMPLVLALVVAIASSFTKPILQLSRWTPLFATIPSNEDCVYVSDTCPAYYATGAVKADDADPAIIAVEIDEDNLYPDEDFIAQCLCLANNGDWKTTRRSVHPYLFQSHWKESLAYNGVACSQSISPQQILDYRVIPWKGNGELLLAIGAAALPTTRGPFKT